MKREAIKIDYIGSCLSVNHYLGRRKDGGYYVKQETKDWMTEFQWLLKILHLEEWKLPLEVTCSGYFKNEQSAPDLSNLSKVIMDSIEELIGVNDKDFRWHDGTRNIGEKHPYLIITISEPTQVIPIVPSKSKSRGMRDKTRVIHQVKKQIDLKSNEKTK